MSTATDLTALGWRCDSAPRTRTAIGSFQAMYNLTGAPLEVDYSAGAKTRAAIATALARKAAGLPTISEHFSATEFRCKCGGYANCKRIWATRRLVIACERFRTLVGPLSIIRGCRCTQENKNVNGAPRSQHLVGNAADVQIFDVSLAQIEKLNIITGVGLYDWKGKRVPRHIDVRSTGTPSNPVTWDYGDATSPPLKPQPGRNTVPTPTPTTPGPPPPLPSNWFLSLDGILDLGTRRALQRMLWATSDNTLVDDGDWGLKTRKAIQKFAGVKADGVIGTITIKALQKKLGHPQTGIWNYGWTTKSDTTTKAFEAYFNRAVTNRRKPFLRG